MKPLLYSRYYAEAYNEQGVEPNRNVNRKPVITLPFVKPEPNRYLYKLIKVNLTRTEPEVIKTLKP